MKNIMILLICISAIASTLQAQSTSDETSTAAPVLPMAPELAKQATDNLKSTLQLDPAQYNKVLEANKKYYLTLEGYRAAGGSNSDSAKAVLLAEKNARLKAIFTQQQMQKAKTEKLIE